MRQKVIVIAEAGVNHNGSIELARQLIDVACEAQADYVKFQTFKASRLVSRRAKLANYQKVAMAEGSDSQYELLKKLELSDDDHKNLIAYCEGKGIKFLSTAFDLESIDVLNSLNIDIFKIPSGEITNLPYLRKIAGLRKKIILSTGMCTMQEVEEALAVLVHNGTKKEDIVVLHCTTEYPAPLNEINLNAMITIRQQCDVEVGYSDHTEGIIVPIAAVAMGAMLIEKHFTLDRNMEGPDHKASLEPAELVKMVKAIREVEVALGNYVKIPAPSEMKNIAIARKSIHLSHLVPAGHVLTENDLEMKRPGDGISPMEMDSIIGRTVNKDLPDEHKLSYTDFR
jgi:N-acetylneuraminate synthase